MFAAFWNETFDGWWRAALAKGIQSGWLVGSRSYIIPCTQHVPRRFGFVWTGLDSKSLLL